MEYLRQPNTQGTGAGPSSASAATAERQQRGL